MAEVLHEGRKLDAEPRLRFTPVDDDCRLCARSHTETQAPATRTFTHRKLGRLVGPTPSTKGNNIAVILAGHKSSRQELF
jgi:hypothetical protein